MARELIFKDPDQDYMDSAIRFKDTGPVGTFIEENETAIGRTGISSGRKRKVFLLSIGDIAPSYQNIASGTYAFLHPLYLVTTKTPSDKVKDFLKFAQSDEGLAVIKRPQGTVTLKDSGALWSKYRGLMKEAR